MIIHSADFVMSNTALEGLPKPNIPEYAFIGRSNVGKSSLINMLTQRTKLSKISSTPGKTQTINHFIINKNWYLVDLPGYGYAKVSKSSRKQWAGFIDRYIMKRQNLVCVFVLIDSRVPPQAKDLEFITHLGVHRVPFVITYTKIDKLPKTQKMVQINQFQEKILELFEESPQQFISSSKTSEGRDDILAFITEQNERFIIPANTE